MYNLYSPGEANSTGEKPATASDSRLRSSVFGLPAFLHHPRQTDSFNFTVQIEGKNIGHSRNKIDN
jgi:hypothetical protein